MKYLLGALLLTVVHLAAAAEPQVPVHGLWVWKSESVLDSPRGPEALRAFCLSAQISEVYLAVPKRTEAGEDAGYARLISILHEAGMRVEALISSVDGDEPGEPREQLLSRVRSALQFNRQHPAQRFDGIHLDIEPQQRAENKGPGNLNFLRGLIEAYRDVGALATPAGLTLNADVPMKLLKGDLEQRRALLTAVPRLTLMLYELSSADDGTTAADKEQKLRDHATLLLRTAYQDVGDGALAKMAIALRTPDYGPLLPRMLGLLDEANRDNPHYLGWARHSYNDVLAAGP
ncbi:MAG TPA: hypothetical protein VK437_13060 [Steroidobacteraceae bacterium]|nr:hypothetical protein [Steroidobacteraceae bacterium]